MQQGKPLVLCMYGICNNALSSLSMQTSPMLECLATVPSGSADLHLRHMSQWPLGEVTWSLQKKSSNFSVQARVPALNLQTIYSVWHEEGQDSLLCQFCNMDPLLKTRTDYRRGHCREGCTSLRRHSCKPPLLSPYLKGDVNFSQVLHPPQTPMIMGMTQEHILSCVCVHMLCIIAVHEQLVMRKASLGYVLVLLMPMPESPDRCFPPKSLLKSMLAALR